MPPREEMAKLTQKKFGRMLAFLGLESGCRSI
jgi:hypothetical protein